VHFPIFLWVALTWIVKHLNSDLSNIKIWVSVSVSHIKNNGIGLKKSYQSSLTYACIGITFSFFMAPIFALNAKSGLLDQNGAKMPNDSSKCTKQLQKIPDKLSRAKYSPFWLNWMSNGKNVMLLQNQALKLGIHPINSRYTPKPRTVLWKEIIFTFCNVK